MRHNVNKVLITGATGYVGSALAASFLARSVPVVVLSRNDPDGERTESAILDAAQGFGLDITQAIAQHLDVVNVDFSDLEHCVPAELVADVTAVWHCAAQMSYSPNKLASSFEVNVGNTTRLFKLLGARARGLRRFYYVSTAYVAGMRGGKVEEDLHPTSELINCYQISKWSAEQALHLLHTRSGVPLTIFRPTVVVGHRKSGWTTRSGFGFYMFADAMRAFADAGYNELTIDLSSASPDLISVDQLAADAVGLTLGEQDQARKRFEVFHCSGGLSLNTQQLMRGFGDAAGVRVGFGRPVTSIEQKFHRAIELNMPFANTEWEFARAGLDRALGRSAAPPVLSSDEISGLIAWYMEVDPEAAAAGGAPLSALAG